MGAMTLDAIQLENHHGYMLAASFVIIAGFLVGARRFSQQKGSTEKDRYDPVPCVPYVIPYLGSALSLRRDPVGFVRLWSRKLNSDIFGAYIGGKSWVFVTDPFAAEQIISGRNPYLSWRPVKFQILKNGGGISADEDARVVSDNRGSHAVIDKYLFKGLDGLNCRYQKALNESVLADLGLAQGSSNAAKWESLKLLETFGGAIWRATMLSLYGFPEMANTDDFFLALKVHSNIEKLMTTSGKRMQKYRCPQEFAAREMLIEKIKSSYEINKEEGASEYIKEISSIHGSKMKNPENLNRYQFINVIAATTLNTIPTMFWVAYYLLASQDAYNAVENEILSIYRKRFGQGSSTENFFFSLEDLDIMFNLDSLITEVLRLRTTQRSFRSRTTSADCDLKLKIDGSTKVIKLTKGMQIVSCPSLLHQDEEVFEDAMIFKWDRFVPDEDGNHPVFTKNGKKLVRPVDAFGGGPTMCPGRKFARAEIKSVIANALLRCDLRFGGDSPSPPEVCGDVTTSGMPRSDVVFEARRRELV